MEHQHNPTVIKSGRSFRLHPAVWLIGAGLVAALIAIFVFKVAIGTVITYAFIGVMLSSHLFMHGGHGSHGGHSDPSQRRAIAADINTPTPEDSPSSKDNPAGPSGGCH